MAILHEPLSMLVAVGIVPPLLVLVWMLLQHETGKKERYIVWFLSALAWWSLWFTVFLVWAPQPRSSRERQPPSREARFIDYRRELAKEHDLTAAEAEQEWQDLLGARPEAHGKALTPYQRDLLDFLQTFAPEKAREIHADKRLDAAMNHVSPRKNP